MAIVAAAKTARPTPQHRLKRLRCPRVPMPQAAHCNARWSCAVLAGGVGPSHWFRILAMISGCCGALQWSAFRALALSRDRQIRLGGNPACTVSDNALSRGSLVATFRTFAVSEIPTAFGDGRLIGPVFCHRVRAEFRAMRRSRPCDVRVCNWADLCRCFDLAVRFAQAPNVDETAWRKRPSGWVARRPFGAVGCWGRARCHSAVSSVFVASAAFDGTAQRARFAPSAGRRSRGCCAVAAGR